MERDWQEIKEEVKARTDIVELIGGYTRLKRSGKNWTGLCPFHSDKRPSFSVSPLGFYKCFSCGESGDLFTFVQKKEGLDFVESLEWLCRRAGIPFTRTQADPQKTSEREEALELNRIAVAFYQDRLTKSSDARDYLAERAILKPTQEQWEIGFAPPDWDGLVRHLERRDANLPLAAKIGLIKERKMEGSGYYDAFRNRLMFPIHDIGGRVIAFGGRAMSKEEQAKYLNSEQSMLFDKSRTLYGLYFARRALSDKTPAVFVEGYVDVIATHQAGFSQCVATLGTSMTEEHAKMLARYSPKVIICYDADTAGIKATLRGASVWESIGVEGAELRVARLPAGDDPDSLLRRGETAAFQVALDSAIPRADFEIELALQRNNLQTEAGKANALAEVIPILASIPSQVARGRYIDKIVHLHPLYQHIEVVRAVEQILADVEQYIRQSNHAQSPRDKGYPLTNEMNGKPVNETPPPPTYQPPGRQQWGKAEFPYTNKYVGKGERGEGQNGNRSNWKDRKKDPTKPVFSDSRPPELVAHALSGAEKAERRLLRALFTADWRTYILSRQPADCFATDYGKRLFALVARTPSEEDGSIDPVRLLRHIEREEDGLPFAAPAESPAPQPESEVLEEDPFADEELPPEMASELAITVSATSEADPLEDIPFPTEPPVFPEEGISRGEAKFSAFLRELLEDSTFLVSKEHLNEDVVNKCIHRLKRYRDEQILRELEEVLRQSDAMPAEQRRAFIEQYHRKTREIRGSSPNREENDELPGEPAFYKAR